MGFNSMKDLHGRQLQIEYSLASDTVVLTIDIDGDPYRLELSDLLFFSISNPMRATFPMIADSRITLLSEESCMKLYMQKSNDESTSGELAEGGCWFFESEGAISLTILAKHAFEA